MNKNSSLFVIVLGLFLALAPSAFAIDFELIHTKPNCQYVGRAATYCTNDDVAAADAASGMIERINSVLDQYAIAKIANAQANSQMPKVWLAYLSFTNKGVQAKVCEVAKLGVRVRIFLDYGSKGQVDDLLNCQKDATQPNLSVSYLGGTRKPWRLQHNKFLIIDPADGSDFSVNFSSGNLSTLGTSLHLDHWVLSSASSQTNFVRSHLCVIDGLESAVQIANERGMYSGEKPEGKFDREVAGAFLQRREACYGERGVLPVSQTEEALALEGVAPSYSPNRRSEVLKILLGEIQKVTAKARRGEPTSIEIAIQHFLSRDVASALSEAASAGADVRLVMDDDVVLNTSGVMGVTKFYREYLKPTSLKIRFVQTNSRHRQMMHNKLAIFDGKRTFSGAGHYTTSALKTNWENFYLIENAKLTNEYANYFEEIWGLSLSEDEVLASRANTAVR